MDGSASKSFETGRLAVIFRVYGYQLHLEVQRTSGPNACIGVCRCTKTTRSMTGMRKCVRSDGIADELTRAEAVVALGINQYIGNGPSRFCARAAWPVIVSLGRS